MNEQYRGLECEQKHYTEMEEYLMKDRENGEGVSDEEIVLENEDLMRNNNVPAKQDGDNDDDQNGDGNNSWSLCASSFIIITFVFGIHVSFGLFLSEYLQEFKQSESKTALVGSLAANLMFTSFPLASVLSNYISVYVTVNLGAVFMGVGLLMTSFTSSLYLVYLTYSVIFSIGSGLSVALLFVVVPETCKKRRSLVAGILMSATSLGMVILPPISEALLTAFGWRHSLRILSTVSIVTAVCSLPLRNYATPRASDTRSRAAKFYPDLSLFGNTSYVIWVLGASVGLMCHSVPNIFMILFARDFQDENCSSKGSLLLTCYGIMSLQSRVIFGFMSDYIKRRKLYLYVCSMAVIAVASFACALYWSYWMLISYILVSGCVDGAVIGLLSIMTLEMTGADKFKDGWTMFIFIHSNIMMIGAPVAGWLVDLEESYQPIFNLRGATLIIGAIIILLIPLTEAKLRGKI